MFLESIWRYPVKSMAGESLERCALGTLGLAGDRIVHVEDRRGRFLTARSHPKLLGHRGTLDELGEPLVDGRPWQDDDVARDVEAAAEPGAHLVRYEGNRRFDILPLLVATDGALAAFGRDSRRLRANLILGGVEGLEERNWEGRRIRVGKAIVELVDLRMRCVMTTWDPDTQEQDPAVLRDIVRRFGGTLALNAQVLREAEIAVGDPVELLPP